LNEAAKRGEKRLLAALAVAKAAGALWERNQVMRAILTALRDHFGQYSANASPYLLLYNADDQMLELPEEAREFYPALQVLDSSKPIRLPLDAPRIASKVARRCLDEKRVVVVSFPDVTEEEDYEAPDATTRSELCAGLWRDGNLLGVLVLKSQQINAFTKEDEQLFELVTEQVAAALERANQVAEKRFNDYLTGAMAWASDIAHDINVDISYIRYRAYWLREREPGITAQGKQWAKEIDDRAGQLAHKARDESSERSKVPLEVGAFLEKKVREWQPRACPNTKISYEWADAELPALVYPEQVWRAVRHLLRNALEAMNYKGHIWLRARPFGSEQVELQVENSGADIPFEVRQRLFREPYSTKSVGGGMGLLIAKMLIEVMDGAISLLPPEEGRGPVFAIRLPQADQPWERQDDLA
jgi:signal transduction histidine kinase